MVSTYDSLMPRIKADRLNLMLAAAGFAPLLGVFLVALWNRPTYQFFPLALIAAGMLAWRAANESGQPVAPGGVWPARLLGLAAGILYLTANILWSPWLGYISFILGLLAALWSLGGRPLVRALAPAGLMLLAILPPPLGWDQTLTLWLRSLAVSHSSALLDLLRVVHAQDGNTLLLPGKPLLVEEACSGINSFFLCNAFCLFWVLWQRRPLAWLLLAWPAISLFVILGNTLRITIGAAGFYYWKLNLLTGWQHETFGLILVLTYTGLIMSLDQLILFLTQPVLPQPVSKVEPAKEKTALPDLNAPPPAARFGPIPGFKLAGPILAVVGLGVLAGHLYSSHGPAANPFARLNRQEVTLSLPASIAGWQRMNSDAGDKSLVATLGVHSLAWRFQREGIQATVAVDYPLDGFHNVAMCYSGNGWKTLAEDELLNPRSQERLNALKLTLEKSINRAVVYHSVVDRTGRWLAAPKQLQSRLSASIPSAIETGYRVQLITGSYKALPATDSAAIEGLFLQARQTLVQQLVNQLGNQPGKATAK